GWSKPVVGLPPPFPSARRDFVVEHEHGIVAWVRVDNASRAISFTLADRAPLDVVSLIRFAIGQLRSGPHCYVVVRDYQAELGGPLEEVGFRLIDQCTLFARPLMSRVPEGKLVPVIAH